MIQVLVKIPAVHRERNFCEHNFLDPFRRPCLLDGGLRSTLPNGSGMSRAGDDALYGSATASPGRLLRENFSPQRLLSEQKESDSWLCL